MSSPQSFTFVVWREGKHFISQCLNVDVSSFGLSYEEAMQNGREALNLYLEDAKTENIQSVEMPSITVTTDIKMPPLHHA